MTAAILQQLEGLSRVEAVKIIINVLHELTAGISREELPGSVSPVKVRKREYKRFSPAWDFLDTVPEFTSHRLLRIELLKRFGVEGTPSLGYLSRYLKENRGMKCK